MSWASGITHSITAGILWGLAALAINALTGAFPLEDKVLNNIVTFSIGGIVFGLVTGGLLMVTRDWLPFRDIIAKAVLVSTGIWGTLRVSGFLLSSVDPTRYQAVAIQTLQGLFLAIVLGGILGALWKKEEES